MAGSRESPYSRPFSNIRGKQSSVQTVCHGVEHCDPSEIPKCCHGPFLGCEARPGESERFAVYLQSPDAMSEWLQAIALGRRKGGEAVRWTWVVGS